MNGMVDTLLFKIFVQILTPFPTRSLLPISAVSHRFHALVIRILNYRLRVSASLKDLGYHVILECFHPSSKLTEPNVFCEYLGQTDALRRQPAPGHQSLKLKSRIGVGIDVDELGDQDDDESGPGKESNRLVSLYQRFRPVMPAEDVEVELERMRRRRATGGTRVFYPSSGLDRLTCTSCMN